MNITKLLQDNQIFCKVEAPSSKEELLNALAQPLADNGVISDKEAFIAAVLRREEDMPTLTNTGIALPHACHSSVNKLGFVIASIAGNGMEYADDMDCTCKLLFLICIPEDTPAAHIPLYSFIADFITNSGQLDELINAPTPDVVKSLLTAWQEKNK